MKTGPLRAYERPKIESGPSAPRALANNMEGEYLQNRELSTAIRRPADGSGILNYAVLATLQDDQKRQWLR